MGEDTGRAKWSKNLAVKLWFQRYRDPAKPHGRISVLWVSICSKTRAGNISDRHYSGFYRTCFSGNRNSRHRRKCFWKDNFFGCNPSYGSLNTIPPGLELAILLASEKNVQSVFDFCLRKCAISHHKQYFQEQLRYLNGWRGWVYTEKWLEPQEFRQPG